MSDNGLVITTPSGRKHRFEDGVRWGPNRMRKDGEISNARIWGERNPFWPAYSAWSRQGKRVAEDGFTCIVDLPATDRELWRLEQAEFERALTALGNGA